MVNGELHASESAPAHPAHTEPSTRESFRVLMYLPRGWTGSSGAAGPRGGVGVGVGQGESSWLQRKDECKLVVRGPATAATGGGKETTMVLELEAPSPAVCESWFVAFRDVVFTKVSVPVH
jgi:hypothetical protein